MASDNEHERYYLTVVDAARILGFTPRTITRWINEGRVPYVVVAGEKRLFRHDLERFQRQLTEREPDEKDD